MSHIVASRSDPCLGYVNIRWGTYHSYRTGDGPCHLEQSASSKTLHPFRKTFNNSREIPDLHLIFCVSINIVRPSKPARQVASKRLGTVAKQSPTVFLEFLRTAPFTFLQKLQKFWKWEKVGWEKSWCIFTRCSVLTRRNRSSVPFQHPEKKIRNLTTEGTFCKFSNFGLSFLLRMRPDPHLNHREYRSPRELQVQIWSTFWFDAGK